MRIAREAWPFAAVLAVAALLAGWLVAPWLALLPLSLLLFVLYFFRDPERTPPDASDAIVSPADGRVVRVTAERVDVFLNLFDVHVCRAPVAGRVRSIEHTPGRFVAAWRDDASEANERTRIVIDDGREGVGFTLIAGLVARRIVCKVAPGQLLAAGQRIGLIRFGSRVDVRLPRAFRPVVQRGQRVVAGETILARHGERAP
jgi:phosphatidylserine decarboxylase